jgi:magnesium chelatase family protein
MEKEARDLLLKAVDSLSLSARSYFKTIKLARTIADLANSSEIKSQHIAESLQYRVKEL